MPERPVPPKRSPSILGVPAHQPLDTIGNLQAISDASRRAQPSALLQLLPSSNDLIRTNPQQNYGIPTDSSIRPMTPQDYASQPGTQSAIDLAAGFAAPTVYHGSPHMFDAFDPERIGTGEGAQTYGHGLYFSENPKVAESYRQNFGPNAYMYHTDIPDEHVDRMLHWDNQLDRQNPQIGPVIDKLIDDFNMHRVVKNWTTGAGLYKQLSRAPVIDEKAGTLELLGNKGASEELMKRGIPGIQYFDQMSRNAQKGTRNLVVFDPSIIKSVTRK